VVARSAVAVYTIVLIRLLEKAEYGDFAFAFALAAILATLADGGFSRLLIRDFARGAEPRTLTHLLATRGAWSVITALAATAIWVGGGLDLSPSLFAALLAFLLAEAAAGGFEFAAIGLELPGRVAIGQAVGAVLVLGALVYVGLVHTTPAAALLGLAVASTGRLAWHLFAWRNVIVSSADRVARGQVVRWVRQAAPYLAVTALGTIYYRADIVILHSRRGASETAPYAAAYRIVDAALVIGGVVAAAVSPHFSRLHTLGVLEVTRAWRRYLWTTALVVFPCVVVLAAVAFPLSGFLFGDDYRDSAGLALVVLAPGIGFMFLQIVNAVVVFTGDRQGAILVPSLVQLAVNVGLTWWLVAKFGSTGAASATTISEVLTFVYFSVFIRLSLLAPRPGTDPP
jgi:O-antigen/teichoic acid export membrane protein